MGFTRAQLDEFCLASHANAAAAQDDGRLATQIAPVTLPDGTMLAADEGIRRGGTLEALASSVRSSSPRRRDHRGQLLADQRRLGRPADDHQRQGRGTRPHADRPGAHRGARRRRPGDHADRADAGDAEGAGRSGLSIGDIGAFEVNEAFAPVPLAWLADVGADPKAVNPNGGAIAIGHPLGGSGARIMTTLVHHMRDKGIRYGLQTMCEGGGQANATILELL